MSTDQTTPRIFNVTTNQKGKINWGWKHAKWSLQQAVTKLTNHLEQDAKDGPCFVPGKILGDQRNAKAVERLEFAVYDIDRGQTYDEVKRALDETEYAYILYTTFSHLAEETELPAEKIAQWAVKNGFTKSPQLHLEPNCAAGYLASIGKKDSFGEFKIDPQLRKTSDGMQVVIRHEPIEKFRVCFPLAVPFVLAEHGFDDKDQQNAWKRYYIAIGAALGLAFDRSCTDVPRMLYMPAHRNNMPHRSDASVAGRELLDYRKFVPAEPDPEQPKAKNGSANTRTPKSDAGARASNGSSAPSIDSRLIRFAARYGKSLDLPALLRDLAPEHVLGERATGGVFIECPFEVEHTVASLTRTWATAPTDEYGFGIFCSGNACSESKDRLIYVSKMLADGWFEFADLCNPEYGGGPLETGNIKERLQEDSALAVAAMLALYSMQSEQERDGAATIERNGQGFNAHDGPVLSPLAAQYLDGKALSGREVALIKKKISKYHKQITPIIGEVELAAARIADELAEKAKAREQSATGLPEGFYREEGRIKTETFRNDTAREIDVCQDFEVVAATLTLETDQKHGLKIRFLDRMNRTVDFAFNQGDLAGNSDTWKVRLANAGFITYSDSKTRDLLRWLPSTTVSFRAVKCGWHNIEADRVFVLPGRTIGAMEVTFDADGPLWSEAGTVEEWKQEVARFAINNPHMMFAISAAFMGPLLRPLGVESGGCLFYGASSEGKSTLLKCATSVWGPKVINMNATKVGVEALLVRHNDTFAPLDEFGQLASGAGEIAYMLGNESGRARGRTDGELREVKRFKTFALMTGEQRLADKIEADGKKATAGQEIRILTIAANGGVGHGCFHELHGEKSGASLSDRLVAAIAKQHGTAGPAFVQWLHDNFDMIADLGPRLEELTNKAVPPGSNGQVVRAARRLMMVGIAGELAIESGVVPWAKGSPIKAAKTMLSLWLEERGGSKSSEALLGMRRIWTVMRTRPNQFARPSDTPPYRSGFRDENLEDDGIYYWYTSEFAKECGSCNPTEVAKALSEIGCLVHDKGRWTKRKRFSGRNDAYYAVRLPGLMDDFDDMSADDIIAGMGATIAEIDRQLESYNRLTPEEQAAVDWAEAERDSRRLEPA